MHFNYFTFKRFDDQYLLTNDLGKHVFLPTEAFRDLVLRRIHHNHQYYEALSKEDFIFDGPQEAFVVKCAGQVFEKKKFLFSSAQLHIFVLTNACNLSCSYCQMSAKSVKCQAGFMTIETAKSAVDLALKSNSNHLTFEFQGGEPFLNFEVLKWIVEYTLQIKPQGKKVEFCVVSNLTILTNDIIDFILSHRISVSTSIDGTEAVHNQNRRFPWRSMELIPGSNATVSFATGSYEITSKNLRKLLSTMADRSINDNVGVLATTTKAALNHPEEMVKAFENLGINEVFIRPLTPLGYSLDNWNSIGYTAEDFIAYYRKVINQIIEINKQGRYFREFHFAILLHKVLGKTGMNYMELRSPCGAGVGQLAYNYDGDIYTCDEARMIAETGDPAFRIGNVQTSTYNDLIEHEVTKSLCVASCLETLPGCSDCVYKPYCGVCPIFGYMERGNLWSATMGSYKCKIYQGMLDFLFECIRDDEKLAILRSWI